MAKWAFRLYPIKKNWK